MVFRTHFQKPSQPVLLIGAGGMLGRAWRQILTNNRLRFHAPSRAELDLADDAGIRDRVTSAYGMVVNCAGYTNVDKAELEPELAYRVNAESTRLLAERCARLDIPLVHYSTDYVFDGCASRPYSIDHPTSPVNVYGRTKAEGERFVHASGCRHMMVRTSWLYAPWGKNFVTTMVDMMQTRDVVRVVNDQCDRPTSAEELAWFSYDLASRRLWGTWHVTDEGDCTWFDFASRIRDLISNCRVELCDTQTFNRPAKRPQYSVLDLSRTNRVLGAPNPWWENVARVLRRMEPEQSNTRTARTPA